MMNKNFKYGLSVLAAVLFIAGCSELKEEKIPTQTEVSIHGVGFTDPSSANFHGKYIQSKNYDLTLCQSCHGTDYSGGKTNQSCNTCHNKQSGPENCTTCHGSVNAAPPEDLSDNNSPLMRGVGMHQKHVMGGLLGAPVACKECHTTPVKVSDAGHIDNSPNAEVKFDSTFGFSGSSGIYNASNVSCTNTYCHGNFNGGNLNRTMTWTNTDTSATACGTCHGDVTKATLKEKAFPKTGHTSADVTSDCSTCHRAVVDANLNIINSARHINGGID